MTQTADQTVDLEGFDPTDPAIFADRVPHDELRALRRTAPVHWVEQPADARAGFPGTGYWAVTRHADISTVSKDARHQFSTWENGAIIRNPATMTREQVELQRVMVINQDPPDHTRLRNIINRGFTPRSIGMLQEMLDRRARTIVGEALEKRSGNFVEDVAAELPLQAISDLLGVPQDDRHKLFAWSNTMMAFDDPDVPGDPDVAAAEILGYFYEMAQDRIAHPRNDIVTKLVQGDQDGHALTADEFGYFTILLTVAGNETTRTAIGAGMKAFLDHPDQWELYKRERPATTVDEIIRWATPVTSFQRTAKEDVEVGGQLVRAGERVGLFYCSANFDEDVFTDPFTFDILRDPNPHIAFGGHGAHYCLGANLARVEINLMFNAIADLMPDITQAGPERRLRHPWVSSLMELPVTYR